MSYPPGSQNGDLIQIGQLLGRLDAQLTAMHRDMVQRAQRLQWSLDHLISILQQQATASQTSNPVEKPASPPSLLASLLEKVSKKVLMDLAIMVLKRAGLMAVQYLIPWSILIGGLTWLGKGLLRSMGFN